MEEWVDLEPAEKASPTAADVRLGMVKRGETPGRLTLIVRREVLDRLGGKAHRYRIARGKVSNKHLLRIVQDDEGKFEAGDNPGSKGKALRLVLPLLDGDPDAARKPQEVAFEIDRKRQTMFVTLPSWVWNRMR